MEPILSLQPQSRTGVSHFPHKWNLLVFYHSNLVVEHTSLIFHIHGTLSLQPHGRTRASHVLHTVYGTYFIPPATWYRTRASHVLHIWNLFYHSNLVVEHASFIFHIHGTLSLHPHGRTHVSHFSHKWNLFYHSKHVVERTSICKKITH